MARAKNHYVNNVDLLETIKKYKKDCRKAKREGLAKPRIPDYIGKCLMLIAENLSHKPNFISYTFRDEMIADGIENCVVAAHSFDPEKSSNPFAYFTQIAWNAFLRRIQKEKKQTYIKHKNYENSFLLSDCFEEVNQTMQLKSNENSSEIIRSFEEKLPKPKKSSKITGVEKFSEEEVTNEE